MSMRFVSTTVGGTCIVLALLSAGIVHAGSEFLRGDVDGNGQAVGLVDSLTILNYLSGFGPIDCLDAADTNDDGMVNIVDPVYMLHFTFLAGNPPPPPFPACGSDPTPDNLDCAFSPFCP